jgi:S-formylglutathione hydrolase
VSGGERLWVIVCVCARTTYRVHRYYLANSEEGAGWDATELVKTATTPQQLSTPILIDQGVDDTYLAQELLPHHFVAAAVHAKVPVTLRMQPGYDHSYFFVSTFIGEHVSFHARYLL